MFGVGCLLEHIPRNLKGKGLHCCKNGILP